MSINTVIIDIYEAKKESLSEERVFELIGVIHNAIAAGELTQDNQTRLLDKLAGKCKNSNQRSYLKKTIQEQQTKSVMSALAELIRKRKISSKDLSPDPSTSVPIRTTSSPIPILQSHSIGAPETRPLLKVPKPRHRSISTPIPSDASSEDRSEQSTHAEASSEDLGPVTQELSQAIQNFVMASVKKSLIKK